MKITRFIRARVAGMVHCSASGNALEAARHEAFLMTHVIGGALAVIAFPVYLALVETSRYADMLAFVWLACPVAIAVYLSRTGRLATAHFLSAAALAGLVANVALVTGGVASFAIFWVAVIPVEAALSGSRRVILSALALGGGVLALLSGLHWTGSLPAPYTFDLDPQLLMMLGAGSALAYIAGVSVKIHDCHETSRKLVEDREKRFALVTSTMTDLLTCHDEAGDVLFITGDAGGISGARPHMLLADRFASRILSPDRPRFAQAIAEARGSAREVRTEFRLYVPNGEDPHAVGPFCRWVEMSCRPVGSESAGFPTFEGAQGLSVVGVTRDIGERKKHQADLEAALDQANSASRMKTEFLAKVSHELRTPLNAVIGFAGVIRDDLAGDERFSRQTEYAGLIHQSGSHLLNIVNDLLDMSRIEAANLSVDCGWFAPADAVGQVADTLREMAAEANVTVAVECDSDTRRICADERAYRQIVINLLGNAVKFTPPGGHVTVRCRTGRQDHELRVSDTGIGIPSDILPRLCTPFVQAENGLDRKHEGTGLGLSVVKGLVELHHGTLDIESSIGRGTDVTVVLPRTQDDTADEEFDGTDEQSARYPATAEKVLA